MRLRECDGTQAAVHGPQPQHPEWHHATKNSNLRCQGQTTPRIKRRHTTPHAHWCAGHAGPCAPWPRAHGVAQQLRTRHTARSTPPLAHQWKRRHAVFLLPSSVLWFGDAVLRWHLHPAACIFITTSPAMQSTTLALLCAIVATALAHSCMVNPIQV